MTQEKIDLKTVDFDTLSDAEIYWLVVDQYVRQSGCNSISFKAPSHQLSEVTKTKVVLNGKDGKLAVYDLRKRYFIS